VEVGAEDIKVISRLVADLCGIVLDESKGYLIKSRLSGVAEAAGCKTFSELYYKARYDGEKALQSRIIDAITTNETLFFRDTSPFDALQFKVIPNLVDEKTRAGLPRRLRIWSAAASTGQEAYSIAMLLRETLPDVAKWDIQILGTDISDGAIRHASLGHYAEYEIQRGMRPACLDKYFTRDVTGYKVKDELRAMVAYRRMNLLEPFARTGPFDVIFCRNVAIYFSQEARRDLFLRLAAELTPGGYLFVGSSESLSDLGPRFAPQQHCRAIFYQPNAPATPAEIKRPVPTAATASRGA
jgi:chemotaxis protein methyltransferase CheR